MNRNNRAYRARLVTGALATGLVGGAAFGIAGAATAQTSPLTPTGPNIRNGNTGGATDSPGPTTPAEANRSGTAGGATGTTGGTTTGGDRRFIIGGSNADLDTRSSDTTSGGGKGRRNGAPRTNGRAGYAVRSVGAASSSLLPNDVRPIMDRMALMLQRAQQRQRYAPEGARASYRAAENALRAGLAAARLAPTGAALSNIAETDALSPASAGQVTEDLRQLRRASKQAQSVRTENLLRRVASLYATGSKEFFTGQFREALLEPEAERIVIRNDNRGYGSPGANTGRTSSAVQAPPPLTNGQQGAAVAPATINPAAAGVPPTTILPGGVINTVPTQPTQISPGVIIVPGTVPVAPALPVAPGLPGVPVTPGVLPAPGVPAPGVPPTPVAPAQPTAPPVSP